jgi:hypothetical protein
LTQVTNSAMGINVRALTTKIAKLEAGTNAPAASPPTPKP